MDRDIQILKLLCARLFVLTGNFPNRYGSGVHVIELERSKARWTSSRLHQRITRQLRMQIMLAKELFSLREKVELVFFDIGEYHNLLPLLLARTLRKRTMIFHRGGNKILESQVNYPMGLEKVIVPIETLLFKVSYALADNILCQSPSIIKFGNLEGYRHKILFWPGSYIDSKAPLRTLPKNREELIGYAGRLSRGKGVMNFVRAMPLILSRRKDMQFLIAGTGGEEERIEKEIDALGIGDHVTLLGWVSNGAPLTAFLERVKILVLPSVTEGTPMIIREAMANGAIVLATPVGGIPDIIRDSQTGFIMRDNKAETIAENVLRVLNHDNLDSIAVAAREVAEQQFTFDAVMHRWLRILETLTMPLTEGGLWN